MNKHLFLATVSAVALLATSAYAQGDLDNANALSNIGNTATSSTSNSGNAGSNVGNVSSTTTTTDVDVLAIYKTDVDVASHNTVDSNNETKTNQNDASFTDNSNVTASVLGATIASSRIDFEPSLGTSYAGNEIAQDAFKNASGINAVNQNTGINANVQQAVTVSVGNVGNTGGNPGNGNDNPGHGA